MLALALSLVLMQPADLVIENARIWSDGRVGFAEFAAIEKGRFVFVGDRAEARIGPETARIDAKNAIVIPGLIDSHAHMLGGGMQLVQVNLRDAKDREDFIAIVRAWAEKAEPGKWILGGRWSVESWAKREQPSKEWIDPVTQGPAWLARMDGHSGLANSAALALAGIDKNGPPDPEGGVIDRDPLTKEPTGILRETAMSLVTRHIPPPSLEDRAEALRRAIRHANSLGVTAVSDIASPADLEVYRRLAEGNAPLQARLFLYLSARPLDASLPAAKAFPARKGWIEVRGFKAYMDGSLGSRTAFMHEPFHGNPDDKKDWRGLPMPGILDGTLEREVTTVTNEGYQAIVHAIGDEGNRLLLDLVARGVTDPARVRVRSEHAQHLLPADIPRFAHLGVIASMQPFHKADDGRYAEEYIGAERCRSSYAFKSLLDAGAVLAFGSDWPVVDMNPFLGMEAAVTGRILGGEFWQTQQNLTVAEALRAYTSAGAFAAFQEAEIGRIAPGYRADFVILDRSPFEASVAWSRIRPSAVYVEGRKVFGQ